MKEQTMNLFGELVDYPVDQRNPSKYDRWKASVNYRASKGDKSIRCKNCVHLIKKVYSKTYYKCELMGNTNGPASDIRVNCVCDKFRKEETPRSPGSIIVDKT